MLKESITKKVVCSILATIMAISYMPLNVFANTNSTVRGTKELEYGTHEYWEKLYPSHKHVEDIEPGHVFETGTYFIDKDITVKKPKEGQSGIIIKGDVVLVIEKFHTLNVKGGNAIGTEGAGAGVELNKGNSLWIKGSGEIRAVGGAACNGQDGSKGGSSSYYRNTYFDGDETWAGCGGAGGIGGGGAGAAIGTKGGLGGDGGHETQEPKIDGTTSSSRNGYNGEDGKDGKGTIEAGKFKSSGDIRVRTSLAEREMYHSNSSKGGSGDILGYYLPGCPSPIFTVHFGYGGGGAGGDGGNGFAAAHIGSGGSGGGGAGGSGAIDTRCWDELRLEGGGGGAASASWSGEKGFEIARGGLPGRDDTEKDWEYNADDTRLASPGSDASKTGMVSKGGNGEKYDKGFIHEKAGNGGAGGSSEQSGQSCTVYVTEMEGYDGDSNDEIRMNGRESTVYQVFPEDECKVTMSEDWDNSSPKVVHIPTGTELKEGRDYKLSRFIENGEYGFKITGTELSTEHATLGTTDMTKPATITKVLGKIECGIKGKTYDGEAIKPTFKVTRGDKDITKQVNEYTKFDYYKIEGRESKLESAPTDAWYTYKLDVKYDDGLANASKTMKFEIKPFTISTIHVKAKDRAYEKGNTKVEFEDVWFDSETILDRRPEQFSYTCNMEDDLRGEGKEAKYTITLEDNNFRFRDNTMSKQVWSHDGVCEVDIY